MVFSSSTFLLLFMPITVVVYYLVGGLITKNIKVKNLILLAASLLFYAWGEPVYILLMLISIVFNYVIGLDIDAAKQDDRTAEAKAKFVIAIVFNIAVLGFFKYFGFFVQNINSLFGANLRVPELALPIGISFYTFQIMSYIIDLYRGKVDVQKKFVSFALYISLFPQLIAGPIVKYKEIEHQLLHRRESLPKFSAGLSRFTVGLAKKLIFANTLGAVYTQIQTKEALSISALTAWIGIICYTLQIYFDFSGYSDMAIGLGRMFGFKFNENFNYPYIAKSITDFWRRWHISLSTWFRDYVYIPLGGNRRKTPRVIFNIFVVWMLTGFWHGAAWNFVMWGVYYGVLLIAEKYVFKKLIDKMPTWANHVLTLIIVMLGWVFFSAPNLTEAMHYISAMFFGGHGIADGESVYLFTSNILLILAAAFCATPIYKSVAERMPYKAVSTLKIIALPMLLLLCYVLMISETYNPFLYFRF
ncbi:MAG: MBOAT family protein [Ruminococcaceae bacterium]|nr:MBOAT family protein [Oscillospiraceae bacterium]